eukprot:4060437-Pyramimonas_sp.AAC.1
MLTTLEQGLDRMGYIRYDKECPKPCPPTTVEGNTLKTDLFFQDVCYPVGISCGGCNSYSHEERPSNTHGPTDPIENLLNPLEIKSNYSE